jgi:hypothetical protein
MRAMVAAQRRLAREFFECGLVEILAKNTL